MRSRWCGVGSGAAGVESASEPWVRSRLRWVRVEEVPKLSGAGRSRFLIKHHELILTFELNF